MGYALHQSPRERFYEHVLLDDGCWLWTGKKFSSGYGRFNWRGKSMLAHRAAWWLYHNQPPGLVVMHLCDNPLCVKPDHLRLGDHADNSADMRAKGRGCIGEKNPHAKLTADDVLQIRALCGHETNASIARRYGLSTASVWAIQHRKSWGHV